jgi:hypothetical protein
MKARPILMSAPMVRALLEGRKTQTRRKVKGIALDWLDADFDPAFVASPENGVCPYGHPGDLLWVRETIEKAQDYGGIGYPADGTWYPASAWEWKRDVVPSIHMPRRLSRLTLEITGVRVERLQDISEADCWAEGIEAVDGMFDSEIPAIAKRIGCSFEDAKPTYACLWESINGHGAWSANPFVWVLEFRAHKLNVDDLLKSRTA